MEDPAPSAGRAAERFVPLLYRELRRLARARLAAGGTTVSLEPAELVQEACRGAAGAGALDGEAQRSFLEAAAEAMRRLLAERDRARTVLRDERGPRRFERLDDGLGRLERLDPRLAAVVKLRLFAGLPVAQVAEALSLESSTVERDWVTARAWLRTMAGEELPS